MAEKEPIFVPPKAKWRPWNSYKMQKFLYYARFPGGRFITKIVGGTIAYLIVYNTAIYLWKGSDHPLNNFRWYRMKARGLLSEELMEKERLIHEFDKEQVLLHSSIIPTGRGLTQATQNRMF